MAPTSKLGSPQPPDHKTPLRQVERLEDGFSFFKMAYLQGRAVSFGEGLYNYTGLDQKLTGSSKISGNDGSTIRAGQKNGKLTSRLLFWILEGGKRIPFWGNLPLKKAQFSTLANLKSCLIFGFARILLQRIPDLGGLGCQSVPWSKAKFQSKRF